MVYDAISFLTDACRQKDADIGELEAEIKRLRAAITRAKDALLDGQSTQWVHDLLVVALVGKE
jgi:hypothetical protein